MLVKLRTIASTSRLYRIVSQICPAPFIINHSAFRPLTTVSQRKSQQLSVQDLTFNMITQPLPYHLTQTSQKGSRHTLPASWMRCGTSKGLFIDRKYLPDSEEAWKPWLVAAMGSKAGGIQQIDGIGGATSTTSKVAVVSRSMVPGIDIEYTFAQVAVGKSVVDFSGNCGNIASGVGPFALEQGIVDGKVGQKEMTIKILNKNTNSILIEKVALDEYGCYEESGDYSIPGVNGSGSEVRVSFVNPAGSVTGRLFPTGRRMDTITVNDRRGTNISLNTTMIDAGNPFVLVDAMNLSDHGMDLGSPSELPLDILESIRQEAAVKMGLARTRQDAALRQGTPKLALVWNPSERAGWFRGDTILDGLPNISIASLSMGKLHPSLQLTGAVAISAALSIDGTLPFQLQAQTDPQAPKKGTTEDQHEEVPVRIQHPAGQISVEVTAKGRGPEAVVESCTLSRTARTLFEGQVIFRP